MSVARKSVLELLEYNLKNKVAKEKATEITSSFDGFSLVTFNKLYVEIDNVSEQMLVSELQAMCQSGLAVLKKLRATLTNEKEPPNNGVAFTLIKDEMSKILATLGEMAGSYSEDVEEFFAEPEEYKSIFKIVTECIEHASQIIADCKALLELYQYLESVYIKKGA